MTTMSDVRLGMGLGAQRAVVWVLGQLGDPIAQLQLPKHRSDPYPLYERLRAKGPLSRSKVGALLTSSHPLSKQVLQDRRFGMRPSNAPPPQQSETFLQIDPPDHTRLRRLAAPAFSPRKMKGYRDQIEKTTQRLLDAAMAKGTFDLITDFASPLPIAVISDLLGVPEVDFERFARYGRAVGGSLDGVTSVRQSHEVAEATRDLDQLFGELIVARTAEPADDVITQLAEAMGEEKLTTHEVLATCTLLLIAGFETTVNMIGNGSLALLANPEQWELLRADPAGMALNVVEETLRYDAPVQITQRVAQEELELAGQRLPVDQSVVMMLAGANRDPEVFADPDRFLIQRENAAEHLSFSGGIHYCLGSPLARLEGEIAFRSLAERLPRLRQVGTPTQRGTMMIRGVSSLPVSTT